jgi:hypothetical protein
MRMILEDAARLEMLASEVTVLRRSQQHSQSLAHRRQLVDALLTRARIAWASTAALSERLGEEQSSSPLFGTALTKISEWCSALEDDLGTALTGDFFTGFQASTDKAVRELERQATGMWQRYAAQKMPDISVEVLAALEDDPRAGSTVVRIEHLAEGLFRLRERPIPSPGELGEFDEATAQLRSAWATLDVASLSEEIVAFVRAVNSAQGAPLDSLTLEVREWLEQRGVASHYVIRPAAQ